MALPQPCVKLEATGASVYFPSHFPIPCALVVAVLLGAKCWGRYKYVAILQGDPQSCYKLSHIPFAAGPVCRSSPRPQPCGAQLCCFRQVPPDCCAGCAWTGAAPVAFLELPALCLWAAGCKTPLCLWRKLVLKLKWAWTLHSGRQMIVSRVTAQRLAADWSWGWTWDKAGATNSTLTHGNGVGKYPLQTGRKDCAKQARQSVFRETLQ